MSIQTYAELQTSVTNWLARADLSAFVSDFITIGESRIGREVRSRVQEQRVTTTTSTYINVPSDFLALRSLWITFSGRRKELQYVVPDMIFAMYPSSTGIPRHYTIFGDEIRFGPTPDAAYDVELWYYKKLTALSSAVNTLFTGNPDLYLYASLVAAQGKLKNDRQIALWEIQYGQIRDQLNRSEEMARRGTAMQIVVA